MRLYKYFHPDRIDVLKSGRICFSSPSNLNDPFELKAPFQFYETEDELSQSLKALIPNATEDAMSELPPKLRTPEVRAFLERFTERNLQGATDAVKALFPALQEQAHSTLNKLLGMLCLSETANNLLMWAHYGASHTGFMVEFDTGHAFFNQTLSTKDELRRPRKVQYSEQRPAVLLKGDPGTDMLLVKSLHWQYEQEWRMVLPLVNASEVTKAGGVNYHLFDFPRESIRSITLGCRINPDKRQELLGLLTAEPSLRNATCMQATADPNYFRLNSEVVQR